MASALTPLVTALMAEPFAFDNMPPGLSMAVWKLYKAWLSSRFTNGEMESYGHSFQSMPDTIAMSQLAQQVAAGQRTVCSGARISRFVARRYPALPASLILD